METNYDKIWKSMIDKKLNKTQLRKISEKTTNEMAKMWKNKVVNINIFKIPDCKLYEIIED